MRINRKVILKILRLDKNIYNELASEVSNFQIAIAIYTGGFLLSGLASVVLIRDALTYINENLSIFGTTLPIEQIGELNNLVNTLTSILDSQQIFGLLSNLLLSGILSGVLGVGFIYLLISRFFRKETSYKQLAIIYGFAYVPVLFNSIIFLTDSIWLQIFLIVGTSIFSLVCLGSGLKQTYLLRNIEAFFLVVVSGFGSSLFSQVI
jgi:hypothetical protein